MNAGAPNDQANVVTVITVTRGADAWKRLAANRVSRGAQLPVWFL
jgi:hypothetical protein